MNLDFAEMPGERDLSSRRHILRREQQHLVAQESGVDRAKDVVRQLIGERDTKNLGAEFGCKRTDIEWQHIHYRIQCSPVAGRTFYGGHMYPVPVGLLKHPTDSGRNCLGSHST